MSGLLRWRVPPAWRERRELVPASTALGAVLRGLRYGLIATWLLALVIVWARDGVPFDAQTLLLWIGLGLAAACVGKHPAWLLWVAIDILPFAAVLLAYDRLRGFSYQLGLPGWWHPQIDIDKWLFFGTEPTVWLQEHLKMAHVQWWDIAVCLVYLSYFFVPFVTAGVLWLRSRTEFYRWTLRLVALSFFAYALFVLIPCAPPWAAARCTAAEVASHPTDPLCLYYSSQFTPDGGILGAMHTVQPGAHPYVEATVYRGYGALHIKYFAGIIQKGHAYFDPVAAVPSLHVGATTLFAIFMWRRTTRWLRPLLVAYPLAMSFTLVYTAEHYVTDCIAGAAAAVGISWLAGRIERRRGGSRDLDRLAPPPEPLERPCPPTQRETPTRVLPHATTPSSI